MSKKNDEIKLHIENGIRSLRGNSPDILQAERNFFGIADRLDIANLDIPISFPVETKHLEKIISGLFDLVDEVIENLNEFKSQNADEYEQALTDIYNDYRGIKNEN